MDEVTLERRNIWGICYSVTYEKTNVYCPNCGKQTVWKSGDDYYLASRGYCLSCNLYHHKCGDFYKIEGEDLDNIEIIKSKVR